MSDLSASILAAVIAYLSGSIPFGFVISKWAGGIDIREHGSGNIGASNVSRIVGTKWGMLVLALDLLKGALPVWILPLWLLDKQSQNLTHVAVLTGIAAVVGHMAPFVLRFRGGKGVATGLGVILILGGWSTPIAIAVFAVTFAIWRIASLSSISGTIAFAVTQLVLLLPYSGENWSLVAFSLAVPLMIIFRHKSNIAKLMRGEED